MSVFFPFTDHSSNIDDGRRRHFLKVNNPIHASQRWWRNEKSFIPWRIIQWMSLRHKTIKRHRFSCSLIPGFSYFLRDCFLWCINGWVLCRQEVRKLFALCWWNTECINVTEYYRCEPIACSGVDVFFVWWPSSMLVDISRNWSMPLLGLLEFLNGTFSSWYTEWDQKDKYKVWR